MVRYLYIELLSKNFPIPKIQNSHPATFDLYALNLLRYYSTFIFRKSYENYSDRNKSRY